MAETVSPSFELELKTLPPVAELTLGTGSAYLPSNQTTITVSTDDAIVACKIWGDVDTGADGDIQDIESASNWISLTAESLPYIRDITLTDTEDTKHVYMKVKDDVGNESAVIQATAFLDKSLPEPALVESPSRKKISKIEGKNLTSFTFIVNEDIQEYIVMVVPEKSSSVTDGTEIKMENGSINMHGTSLITAETMITCTISGADLEIADPGDGVKIIKVFAKNMAGMWSA